MIKKEFFFNHLNIFVYESGSYIPLYLAKAS